MQNPLQKKFNSCSSDLRVHDVDTIATKVHSYLGKSETKVAYIRGALKKKLDTPLTEGLTDIWAKMFFFSSCKYKY